MKPGPLDDPDFDPADPDPAEAALRSIREELAEGERLVWFGQPRRSPPTAGAMPLAGVAASVGMLLLLAGLIGGPHPSPAIVFGGFVLALAGAALLTIGFRGGLGPGRLATAHAALLGLGDPRGVSGLGPGRHATAYALTDRRIIVRQPIPIGQVLVQSFRAGELSRISRIERADGSGMILLEGSGRRADGMPTPVQLASLVGLEGVREVEALIRSTLMPV